MNKEKLRAAGIDYDSGLDRFAGNAEAYESTLKLFPLDDNFANLEEALAIGDCKTAFFHAHSLKGISGNLSLNDLYKTAAALNARLRGEAEGDLFVLFEAVSKAYSVTVTAITAEEE